MSECVFVDVLERMYMYIHKVGWQKAINVVLGLKDADSRQVIHSENITTTRDKYLIDSKYRLTQCKYKSRNTLNLYI